MHHDTNDAWGPWAPCITLWMMHGGPGPPCITVRLRASTQPMLDTLTGLQYFDCLPHEYDTWCPHSISKMISASRRIFWDGFQPFLKNTWFSVLSFLLQYFDFLPTKLDTWCCHSIWKMISASRRFFWDVFQPFFKNIWLSVSFCACFSISIVQPPN